MDNTENSVVNKPGYKTTEFWMSLAAIAVGAVQASGLVPNEGIWAQVLGTITVALVSLGYTGARMSIKKQG
jgi:hypothetical protein